MKTHNGGYAHIIKDSVDDRGNRVTTFSLKYGLIVHAEFLRHRLFSNSVKSNRAVSKKQIRKEVIKDPYVPAKFGGDQRGMVSSNSCKHQKIARLLWRLGRFPALGLHYVLDKVFCLHKEVCNRVLIPWQWVRETVTATDFENFFELRLHKDAQEDIKIIAQAMHFEMTNSQPQKLKPKEYHLPYIHCNRDTDGILRYYDNDGTELTTQEAIESSTARCARSSYDNHDGSFAKYHRSESTKGRSDKELYKGLVKGKPMHASCCEHQCMCVEYDQNGKPIDPDGFTHIRFDDGSYWSGNIRGFVQYRQTLSGHTKWGHVDNTTK